MKMDDQPPADNAIRANIIWKRISVTSAWVQYLELPEVLQSTLTQQHKYEVDHNEFYSMLTLAVFIIADMELCNL